ncbi:MAG: 3-keto-disaccharide hydrolase, partial [Cyclobacteriaceae bacterium]
MKNIIYYLLLVAVSWSCDQTTSNTTNEQSDTPDKSLMQAGPDAVPLFNGENLDNWVQRNGEAIYSVEDGEIVGTTVYGTPNSFLCTEKDYGDFILDLD